MLGWLFIVGVTALFVGIILLILGIGGEVRADTEFGKYCGTVGVIAVILGITLMVFSAIT